MTLLDTQVMLGVATAFMVTTLVGVVVLLMRINRALSQRSES